MTVQMVTVTWDETDIGGAGLTGTIRFLLSAALVNATTGQIYEPDSRSYAITGGTGQTVPIVPNDSTDLTPTGTYYTVTIAIAGQAPRVLTKLVNSASGTTQKLAALPDVVPLAAAPLALPLPLNSPPQAGQVPVAVGDGSDNTLWGSGGGGGSGFANPMTAVGDLIIGGTVGSATRLAGNTTTTRKFLRQTGTGSAATAEVWDTLVAGDVPTLNQNTTGTAAGLSSTLAIGSGGTGQTTQQAAIDALTGTQTAGRYLRSDGTHAALAAIQAGDVPVLNQNTTGTAANVTGTVAIANGGTGQTTASAALSALGGLAKAGDTMTGALAPAVVTLTFVGSGTTLVNAALGNVFALTLTASTTTLGNPTNPVDGQAIRVRVIQGGAGSFTLAYGTAYDFGTAGTPTLSTAAGKVDILGFEYVASLSKWAYLGSGLGF